MAQDIPSDYMPYAPAGPVMGLIRRMREGRLPDNVTVKGLEQLGISVGNADRIHKGLRFLGLLEETGKVTPTFDRLGKVSTDEYPAALQEIIQAAYAPVLRIVNPAEDTDVAIFDAFRLYEPSGQRQKMVGLFMALCREAGLVAGGPITTRARASAPRTTPRSAVRPSPPPPGATAPLRETDPQETDVEVKRADYRLLVSLIQQLPETGTWSQGKRDKWVQAMTANVDLLVTVEEEAKTP
jgi:hypothetical protein